MQFAIFGIFSAFFYFRFYLVALLIYFMLSKKKKKKQLPSKIFSFIIRGQLIL